MDWETSFDEYLEHLGEAVGHSDRRSGLVGYCQGLMLPIRRKSVEPLAAHLEPDRVSARHQSLHHFVSKSEWSDVALLEQVRRWVLPHRNPANGLYWITDDAGFPKQGWEERWGVPAYYGVQRVRCHHPCYRAFTPPIR
jgi:SRSO17 transposase